jgi:ABC-type antimicrobial peptide transport system permease subunit
VGGLLIGIPVALLLSRYLQSLLFGLTPADGWSTFAFIVTTALMTLFASIIPARRATRIDPVAALRCD